MRYQTEYAVQYCRYLKKLRKITSIPLFILAICMTSIAMMSVLTASPSFAVTGSEAITTDQIEYMIGDTVGISGANFDPGAEITIDVVRVDGIIDTGVITTDPSGAFVYNYYLNPNALPDPELAYFGTLTVNTYDEESTLLATTTFLDNPNYLLQGCSRHQGDCSDNLSGSGWANGTTPMNGWTTGNVKGWYEQEYVPYRLRINLRKSSDGNKNYYIMNQHDHLRNGILGVDGIGDFYVGSGPDSVVTPEGKLTKNCTYRAPGTGILAPTTGTPCYVSGPIYSGINDDGDGNTDEEIVDGIDNDGDSLIDEDVQSGSNLAQQIQFVSAVRFESSEAGSSSKRWALYWKARLATGSSGFPGSSLHAKTTATGNQDVPISNVLAPAAADLSIAKTDSPDPVSAGGTLTYTITVTNNGPDSASGIQVIDTLPAGVTFVSASGGTYWTCSHNAGVVTCNLDNSCSGPIPPINIVVIAPSPLSEITITNSATVSGSPNDPNPGNNTATASTTVNAVPIPMADLSIVKSDAPDPVNAAGVLVYTLSVTNAGPDSATNVTVTDTLPSGVTYVNAVGTDWTCGHLTGVVTCTYDITLGIGSAPDITITVNTPSEGGVIVNTSLVTGYEDDPDSANNYTTIETTVTAVADMSITKTDSPDPVNQGQQITYTLTVSNAGPSTAPGVTVTDTLPGTYVNNSFSGSGWTCNHVAGIVTCTRPTLNAGTTAPYITFKVYAPSQAGSISNTAAVSSTVTDPNTGDNSASAATTVYPAADLSVVSRLDSPDPVTAGNNLTYTTVITNLGPDTANNVVINDYLPPGAIYVSSNITSGSCAPSGSTVICNVSSIPNGGSVTVEVVIILNEGCPSCGSSASVSSSTYDPVNSNNNKAITTGVTASSDLSISKTDVLDPVLVGDTITYKIVVTNNGPSTNSSLTVTDNLPAGATYQDASGSGWSCGHVAGVVTCTRTNLAPGTAPDITITVTAPATPTTLSNTASVLLSAVGDPDSGNNSQTITTTVNPPSVVDADLSISKSGAPDPVSAGDTLTYTVSVTNNGPASANNVEVIDNLPSGVTFGSAGGTGWTCGHLTGVVTCTYGIPLGIGPAPDITITVTAPAEGGIITNSATVSADEVDLIQGNNTTGPVTTTVGAVADLSITKTDFPYDPVDVPGDPMTYTITVTNNGPSTATGVTMTDTLPTQVSYTVGNAVTSQGSCSGTSPIVCNIGTLANGASATITIPVTSPVIAGMISNTASVTGNEADPNMVNNSAAETTNVGDLSRLLAVSTRAYVGTGTDAEVVGFIIGGTLPKTVLVRGFGPSMSATISGTLADPFLEIYSFADGVYIARNDNWGNQTTDTLCSSSGYVCGSAAEISAYNFSLDPCQQSGNATGCTYEAALLITLPPGAYSGRLSGINNGTGIGRIGVWDLDSTTLPKLDGLSTRAYVGMGTDALVGGFIIGGGGGNKTLLIRAFGPSMSATISGTLADPFLEIYSFAAGAYIARNDNWGNQTTDTLCSSSGYVCGSAAEISATGLDPCQQSGNAVGCNNESSLLITLPPGSYSAKISGVDNGTGIGRIGISDISQ